MKRRSRRVSRRLNGGAKEARPSISGVRLELGRVLAQQTAKLPDGRVHINVLGQQANTLLHDGHAWKDFARTALSATRRAILASRKARASMLVHASFAFVHALERGAELEEPLKSCAEAILECEALVLSAPIPACVVRLGYLYGPRSADLLAYRKAFMLGRPYWSGLSAARQYYLHQFDAASALFTVARPKHAGNIYYATDGHAVSFERFMDAFARRVGRERPLHLPLVSNLLARVIIRQEHMQQTALGMPPGSPSPQVPAWKPIFRDYRRGLDQVIDTWNAEGTLPRR